MYVSVCLWLSYHVNEMPVLLIFGIATTIDSVHHSLPHRVTSLLSMEKFQAPSSSDYLSMVLHQVSNEKIAANLSLNYFCSNFKLWWICWPSREGLFFFLYTRYHSFENIAQVSPLRLTCRPWYLVLTNSIVERCHTDDLVPNIPISCLPPSCVDPEVQELKVIIIDCPQPGSSLATYWPPPLGRWSKCGGNVMVMVLLGSGMSKVSKETQPEWLDPSRHWWAGGDASHCIISSVAIVVYHSHLAISLSI